jgi:hypothetical protein
LVAIIGIKKTMNVRQSGFDGSKRTLALGLATAEDMGAFRTAIESRGPYGGQNRIKSPGNPLNDFRCDAKHELAVHAPN